MRVSTSKYKVKMEFGVKVPMRDGVELSVIQFAELSAPFRALKRLTR